MAADLEQYLANHHKLSTGFMAPGLYRLASDPATYATDFHDITAFGAHEHSNGLLVGAGWDAVTGLGTPDLARIEEDWAATDGGETIYPSPRVDAVHFEGSGRNLRMVITGIDLGLAPRDLPYTGNLCCAAFAFHDLTQGWEAGGDGDPVTLRYVSWNDGIIVIDGFAGAYGRGHWVAMPGDRVEIDITDTAMERNGIWQGVLPHTPLPHACRSTFTHANWPRPIPFPTITIDEPCSGQTFNVLPGQPLVFKGAIHGRRLPRPLRLQFNVSMPSDLNFGTLAFKDLQGSSWEYSWPIDDWLSGRYMFQMLAGYTAGPVGYGSIARRMIDIRTRWSKLAPLPLDRSNLGTAYGPDGRLYAIGGNVSTDSPTGGVITSPKTAEVLALRPGDKRWTPVAPLPRPLSAPLVVTLHDGRILVIGGQSDELEAVSSVYAYDAGQGQWSTLASLPQPREDASATVGQDGKVYVIGGRGYYGQKVLPTEIYDPSSNTWSLAPAPPKSADFGGAAVALADGRIVVVGGLVVARSQGGIELDRSQAQVYAFDPVLRTWRSLRPLPIWRYGMDATTDAEGNIIVLGGHSSMTDDQRFTAEVDKYDVRSGSWERFGFGEIVQRGAIARGNGGVSFLIGGYLNNFSNPARTTVETAVTRYDPNFNG